MSLSPPFPLVWLAPLLLAGGAVALWLGWRSTEGLAPRARALSLALRALALLLVSLCLLDPGRWVPLTESDARSWLILTDRSASMATPESVSTTRWQSATALAEKLAAAAPEDASLSRRTFATALDPADAAAASPDGTGSDPVGALASALSAAAGRGNNLAGIILLTDGRATAPTAMEQATLRARAQEVPVHAVVHGADWTARDLAVRSQRRQVLGFPGQDATLGLTLSARGLGAIRPAVVLADAAGKELERKTVEMTADAEAAVTFTVKAGEQPVTYTLSVEPLEGEAITANNHDTQRVVPLRSKTRVFLAEGAPHWDSKFLAQLLREQPHIDLRSVHRLSDERYFKITSAQAAPEESTDDVFPGTEAELAAYDLVVFGKGADHFLTPQRAEALRAFVRDRGGAVFFARGKAYPGKFELLEPLEPVVWAEGRSGDFAFAPDAEGAAAGLFGEALPAVDSPLWAGLPALRDAQRIDSVRPFTRVMARGKSAALAGTDPGFPLLAVRRYGQGAVGLLNADGLWKWDFFPEARTKAHVYGDFWAQLMQWMASYAEFLPGQDWSLRPASTRAGTGDRVALTIGYRGKESPAAAPVVHGRDAAGASLGRVVAAPATADDGRPVWQATWEAKTPGDVTLTLESAEAQPLNGPAVTLAVAPPPGEGDDLSADADFLQRLTAATGGRVWTADELLAAAPKLFAPPPPVLREGTARWDSLWNRGLVLALLAAALLGEWALRRRSGLV